jgi:hypothetical protein
MKNLLAIFFGVAVLFCGCKKASTSVPSPTLPVLVDSLHLVEAYGWIGPNDFQKAPAPDSSVQLLLRLDGSYASFLNNILICQGTWSSSLDTTSTSQYVLSLNNFSTTGLFSVVGRMIVDVRQDSVYMTPDYLSYDGETSYIFVTQ